MRTIWLICVALTIFLWMGDTLEMQENLGEKAIIESDTLTIVDYICLPYPFTQVYEMENGNNYDKSKLESLIISKDVEVEDE